MNLNFKGVEEAVNKFPDRLDLGLHDVTISELDFKLEVEEGKNPYMTVTFKNEKGVMSEKFYLTEKALGRIQSLLKATVGKVLDKEVSTVEFKQIMEKSLVGKKVRILVTGEEALKDNEVVVYKKLPFAGFVEALSESKLSFNPDRAVKKLPRNTSPVAANNTEQSDDLPF